MVGIITIQQSKPKVQEESLKVLLVGNNPIEMSNIYDGLKSLQGKILQLDTSFSDEDTMKKISAVQPNCIIVDDNLGLKPLKILIDKINGLGKEALSITLLKSDNRQEIISGVQEYLMKEGITPDRIYHSLINAIRFRKTQKFLKLKYYTGKRRLKRMFI